MNVIKVEYGSLGMNSLPNAAYAASAPDPDEEPPSISGAAIVTFYTADGFRYSVLDMHGDDVDTYATFLVDVNGDKGPNTIDTPVNQIKGATCSGDCDTANMEWPDFKLTDVFLIEFDNGRSIIYPFKVSGGS